MYTFLRRVMLAAALLVLLFATNTRVQAPCCEITAIDARTGIVTANPIEARGCERNSSMPSSINQASMTVIAGGTAIFGANMPNGGYIVLYPPGPCPAPATPADPNIPFGWLNPITPQNSWPAAVRATASRSSAGRTETVSTPVKLANCAIAGYTINDIVNNRHVRVRSINVSCVNCHSAWGWQQKRSNPFRRFRPRTS